MTPDSNWGGAREGSGRKAREPGRPRKALSVSVSAGVWESVRAHADATGMSLSEAADGLLAAGIAAMGEGSLERVVPRAAADVGSEEVLP